MRQHCTDGSFRFCRWRTHTEAFSEDSGPEALSTQGQYFALRVFYEILQPSAGELSANCCRTITMTRYNKERLAYESVTNDRSGSPGSHDHGQGRGRDTPSIRRGGRLFLDRSPYRTSSSKWTIFSGRVPVVQR
jgi:hypothetical protein